MGPGTDSRLARLADERVDHRFKGLPPDADGLHRRRAGRPAPQPLHRRLHHPRPRPLRRAPGAQPRAHGDVRRPPRPRLRPARQDLHGPAALRSASSSTAPGASPLAVPHQVRVARAFGIQRIFLANELVDPAALRWIAAELDADPDFRFICYVDSVRGVELMDAALAEAGRAARWTSSSNSAPARAPAPASARRRSARRSPTRWPPPAPCGWSASPATRARCPAPTRERVRAWLRRLVALAADFDKAGRFARRRTRSWSARAAAPGSTRSPTSSPRSPNSPCPC